MEPPAQLVLQCLHLGPIAPTLLLLLDALMDIILITVTARAALQSTLSGSPALLLQLLSPAPISAILAALNA